MGKGQPSSCEYEGSGIKTREGLTGLGDVACWYNDKHGELQVLKGQTMFSVELRRSGDPTEAIKGVARKVYDRVK